MGFYQMMELLQKRENGKIVMCNLGNFVSGQQKDVLKPPKILMFLSYISF